MGCGASSQINNELTLVKQSRHMKFLKNIETLLIESDDSCTMLTNQFWPSFLAGFQNHYLDNDETLELLGYFEKIIQFNFQGQCKVGGTEVGITDFGEMFHKIENKLHFKRKRAEEYLKFISEDDESTLSKQVSFLNLKHDLSQEEVLQVASKTRIFCQGDMKAFAFLSLYLQISVAKSLESESWEKVEQKYTKVIQLLQKKYPANSNLVTSLQVPLENQKLTDVAKSLKDEDKFQNLKFEQAKSAYEILQTFIISKSKEAAAKKAEFDKLFKYLCYQKGYGYKSGVKIKNSESKESIFRTIEKLVEDEMTAVQVGEEYLKKTFSRNQLNHFLDQQRQKALSKMKSILQSKSSIFLKAKDLLRGKSTFERVEDIIEARQKIIKIIESKKGEFQVIEEKNKLYGKTKDLVLIIKLGTVVSQFQLVMKLDSISNEFNHKIYELKRSKVYSMIPNLFIHNQKWCKDFFKEQFALIGGIIEQRKHQGGDSDKKNQFEKFEKKIKEFQILLSRENCLQAKSEKTNENEEIQKNSHSIEGYVKMQRQQIRKAHTKNYQKINEIKYFCTNHNLQKAKEIINEVKEVNEQLEADLILWKGNIAKTEGKANQALKHYKRCLELQTKLKGADCMDVATTLNNIGDVFCSYKDYYPAFDHYKKSLDIKIKVKGAESIDVADTLNNIGNTHLIRGQYVQALEKYKKSLDIKIKVKGADSIDVADTLKNIGTVHYRKYDFANALEHYNKSLDIKIKVKGAESIDVADVLKLFASLYHRNKDDGKALENYNKCLEIQTKIKGEYSNEVYDTLAQIGAVYLIKKIMIRVLSTITVAQRSAKNSTQNP